MENMKELREELSQKIKEGSLSAYDLKNYFLIFCEIGKDSEDFQEDPWRLGARSALIRGSVPQ